MKEMHWDEELARMAQTYINEGRFAHNTYEERSTSAFKDVGQNLAYTTEYVVKGTENYTHPDWSKVVKMWYDEVEYLSTKNTPGEYMFNGNIGHYTQVVWADSYRVGCGASYLEDGEITYPSVTYIKIKLMYNCHYGPAGNININGKFTPYEINEPDSQCPKSSTYDNLCASQ